MKGHSGAHRWLRKVMGHNVYPRGIKKINPGQYLYLPGDGGMAYAFLLHGWLRVWVIYQAKSSEPFNRRYRLEMAHDA